MSISSQNAFSPSNASHFCELRGEFPTFIGEFRSLHPAPAPCRFSQAFLEQNASEIYLSHFALILSSAYAFLPTKKRAEPAFTSAEACHTSKSCSRGRFCAISYMSKKTHPSGRRAHTAQASYGCASHLSSVLKADGAIFFQESNALRTISGAFSLRVYSSIAARQALNAS